MTDLIERELHLDADPATVWAALTDPALLALWLADEATIELRVGGDAAFRCGEQRRSGWVEELVAPCGDGDGRLVFWWAQDGDDGAAAEPASRVELELTATASGTRLRVVETRPLEVLDLVGIPLRGQGAGAQFGPALVAA